MEIQNTSPKGSINITDIWKTARGFLITLAAVAITAVIGHITSVYLGWNYNVCVTNFPCIDLKFIAVPAIGAVLEIIRRWVTDFSQVQEYDTLGHL